VLHINSREPCYFAGVPDGPQTYTLNVPWVQKLGAQYDGTCTVPRKSVSGVCNFTPIFMKAVTNGVRISNSVGPVSDTVNVCKGLQQSGRKGDRPLTYFVPMLRMHWTFPALHHMRLWALHSINLQWHIAFLNNVIWKWLTKKQRISFVIL